MDKKWWHPYFEKVNNGFKCKIEKKDGKACGKFRKSPDSSTGTLWKHLSIDHPKLHKELKNLAKEKEAASPPKKKTKVC